MKGREKKTHKDYAGQHALKECSAFVEPDMAVMLEEKINSHSVAPVRMVPSG